MTFLSTVSRQQAFLWQHRPLFPPPCIAVFPPPPLHFILLHIFFLCASHLAVAAAVTLLPGLILESCISASPCILNPRYFHHRRLSSIALSPPLPLCRHHHQVADFIELFKSSTEVHLAQTRLKSNVRKKRVKSSSVVQKRPKRSFMPTTRRVAAAEKPAIREPAPAEKPAEHGRLSYR